MANWTITNIPAVTDEALHMIRAHDVLGGGVIELDAIEAMVDVAPADWDLALAVIEFHRIGTVIDHNGRPALLLAIIPEYGAVEQDDPDEQQ